MEGFIAFLKEKRGPLPVWAWGGLMLLGLLIAVWWRSNRASSSSSSTTLTDEVPGLNHYPSNVIVFPQITWGGTAPAVPPGSGSPPPTTDDAALASQQWFGEVVPFEAYSSQAGDTWLSIHDKLYAPKYPPGAGWENIFAYNRDRLGWKDSDWKGKPNKTLPTGTLVGIPLAPPPWSRT